MPEQFDALTVQVAIPCTQLRELPRHNRETALQNAIRDMTRGIIEYDGVMCTLLYATPRHRHYNIRIWGIAVDQRESVRRLMEEHGWVITDDQVLDPQAEEEAEEPWTALDDHPETGDND